MPLNRTDTQLSVQFLLLAVRKATNGEDFDLAIAPVDLVRILAISQKIQESVLGKADEDQVGEVHVHFGSYEDSPEAKRDGETS